MSPADDDRSAAARTKRQRLEAREAAILAAAEEEFSAHGFDGARMAEIARRAGMGEGTLYLYFRTKNDLLSAVTGAFWGRLTAAAEAAVAPHRGAFARLRALACFHLERVMADFTLLELATRLRHAPGYDPQWEIEQRRAYVAVFDGIVQQGIDRGEIAATVKRWMLRDVFYGTLEYSARTLLLHGRGETGPVVDHLMGLLAVHDPRTGGAEVSDGAGPDLARIAERLDRAVARLEQRDAAS
ncbi:TetR family transcriptional regulator [Rhodothalassium salexigens DSM 2132]|uniref:TetR family transcriptional regulator n=1 Tax=Rhodothalassium salexigens DSM 2132 TaxID=1188247 RepID=A0A4R2PG12_RHOSA|nr:TetR/AcrR family transcriptional regulator [Rhodothalassium salexigens]MBB4211902.1 TetR/AcrR family fatty acid metabolism transcriptional regulator [Rhodothalassium salexigens DSM 2132]MBK1639817.1 hypothetical protein [Rhodothalassium salexigens DSM 2132]TCP33514.1 TetR family transcriptional regulator [Rhodothalassium salexigens DSM 2132]